MYAPPSTGEERNYPNLTQKSKEQQAEDDRLPGLLTASAARHSSFR